MRNIKLEIEYDGTNYRGWQVQNNRRAGGARRRSKTIQQAIEKALRKILQEKIRLIGAGRTDAGVHANGQVANFKTHSRIALEKLHQGLNALLPQDIAVITASEAKESFHSRFNAGAKIYRYVILNSPQRSAILRNYAYYCRYPLDVKLMRQEAGCLRGRRDFKAFCASGGSAKNTVRAIKRISIKKLPYRLSPITYHLNASSVIIIDIEADGFLYNMARNIAGTLIEIGRGKFPRGSLRRILLSCDRRLAGPTAPAQGLCLVKVKY